MRKYKQCSDCKNFEYDWWYDNENFEEYESYMCGKGHNDRVDYDEEPCEDFEED